MTVDKIMALAADIEKADSIGEAVIARRELRAAIEQALEEAREEVSAKFTSEKYPFVHIRMDASEADKEGALRSKLIELGWIPPEYSALAGTPEPKAPSPEPVAWVIAGNEFDLAGNPIRTRDIDWDEESVSALPVGTKLYTYPAQPAPEPQPKHLGLDAIRQAIEDLDVMERRYNDLAENMVYQGNSVSWWHSKAIAYRDAIGKVWDELRAAGIVCDGSKTCADGVRELASLTTNQPAPEPDSQHATIAEWQAAQEAKK
jgi:hypothetical protein